ncbi:MAG: hypothetical protein WCP77_07000, partial [Roseococcus sp.]
MLDDIPQRLTEIRARIEAATRDAGRAPGAAQLVAVSKTNPAEAVLAALAAGQRLFGENRVQEAATKFPALRAAYPELRLHIIGPLQTNKVLDALEVFDVIQARLTDPRRLTRRLGMDRKYLGSGLYLCAECKEPVRSGSKARYLCRQGHFARVSH